MHVAMGGSTALRHAGPAAIAALLLCGPSAAGPAAAIAGGAADRCRPLRSALMVRRAAA